MRQLLGTLVVVGLVGLMACEGPHGIAGPTGPSFRTAQSNGAEPEVPSGQHPQPNPNKARNSH